jgi:hypothetical protein
VTSKVVKNVIKTLRIYLFFSLKKKNPTPSFLSGRFPLEGVKLFFFFFNFFFIIHMCIQGLGHFFPLPPPEIGFVNAPLTSSEVGNFKKELYLFSRIPSGSQNRLINFWDHRYIFGLS